MGEGEEVKTVSFVSVCAISFAWSAFADPVTPEDVAEMPAAILEFLFPRGDALVRDLEAFRASKAVVMLDEKGLRELNLTISFLERKRRPGGSPVEVAKFLNGLSAIAGETRDSSQSVVDFAQWWTTPPTDLLRGDIVCARFEDPWSRHLANASTRDRRFSHIAVVLRGGDKTELVEAGFADGGETRFAREAWAGFCSGAVDCAVYRYDGSDAVRSRIGDEAERAIGVRFDSVFDLKTKKRLYCSELVRNAVNCAAGREVIGTSRKGDFEYVAIDDCYRTGFVKVFDAREWKPTRQESAPVTPPWAVPSNAPMAKVPGSSATNRTTRVRIVPMHPTKGRSR